MLTPRLSPFQSGYCSSCIRRLLKASSSEASSPSALHQQVRGKKKLTRGEADVVTVRLLKDIPRFGRKGALVPVSAGRMRNEFYPRRMADYMAFAELKDPAVHGVVVERDFTFFPRRDLKKVDADLEGEAQTMAEVDVQAVLLSPSQATSLLSTLLPATFTFHRQPITPSPPTPAPSPPPPPSRPGAINSAASDLSAAYAIPPKPPAPSTPVAGTSIYGSVTTADVAAHVAALLTASGNADAQRVVLGAEDVRFVGVTGSGSSAAGKSPDSEGAETEDVDPDRVKQLGEFEVEIMPRGAREAVRRVVVVTAEAEVDGGTKE